MNLCICGFHLAIIKTGNATAAAMKPAVIRYILYRIAGMNANMCPFIVSGMDGTKTMAMAVKAVTLEKATKVIRVKAIKVAKAAINNNTNSLKLRFNRNAIH